MSGGAGPGLGAWGRAVSDPHLIFVFVFVFFFCSLTQYKTKERKHFGNRGRGFMGQATHLHLTGGVSLGAPGNDG